MKQKSKLTVTIGIPAYNEEENINRLLRFLATQRQKKISIQKIIVVSDGSTDKTVAEVKKFKDKRILYIESDQRLGKPSRLNQLFAAVNSEILVIIDADTICPDPLTIEKLVSKFRLKNNIGLVTGNTQPLPGRTFIEESINNYIDARNRAEKYFDIGKTAYSTRGFLAYSRGFLKNFRIPVDILNDDAYSYFTCISSEWKHVYAKNAIAYYRLSGSMSDYSRQIIRYMRGGQQLHKYFEGKQVSGAIKIPLKIALRILIYQLLHNPIGYIVLKTVFLYSYLYFRLSNKKYEVKWQSIRTTKSIV